MTVIDARVRLPQELRPDAEYSAPRRQTEQYDKVLNLREKMNGGTLEGLLSSMKAEGITYSRMHPLRHERPE